MERYSEETVYRCNFCNKMFADTSNLEKHLEECLLNFVDNSSCVTCKHANLNLEAPYMKENGYSSLRLLEVLGARNFFTCGKNVYDGKLTQDKIMRFDKKCYDGVESPEDDFVILKTDEYLSYVKKMEQIDKEQEEIDNDIREFKELAAQLLEEGKTEEEIEAILEEKYSDE